MLSKELAWIDPKSIIIGEGRQRSGEIDISDLIPSIRERGVINPIVVRENLELVAGERRTRAALAIGLAQVPVRYYSSLDTVELRIIELEENERRQDLPWKDQVRAIAELHGLYAKRAEGEEAKWSAAKTAEILFYDHSHVIHVLRVYRDLDNPRIAAAPGLRAAYNVLSRIDERRIGDAMSAIANVGQAIAKPPIAPLQPLGVGPTPALTPAELPKIPEEELSILQIDFETWAEAYQGEKFNLIHCDFPYGVDLFAGPQSGRDKWQGYDDDPNVYWELLRVLCKHRDRFMAQSAHMIFWLTADVEIQFDTIEFLRKHAPEFRIWPKPLIWHKTDNVGLLSDPKRGPRHIYETALMMSRDDRYILKAKSDVWGAPTNKEHHPSTKPEPMLRVFMEMFVDEHTRMLDPTCGSGAALRAAESLGAVAVLGLEINGEHCANARSALRQFRAKARAARKS